MPKIILGFTGLIACGKGTAGKYFVSKYSAQSFRYSTILRDLLTRLYLPHSRENLQDISTILRQRFGQDLLAKIIVQDVARANSEVVIVEGIRRIEDVQGLKTLPGFKLVSIEVEAKLRYERLVKRNENPDDKNKTWEQFVKDHEAETEVTIPPLMKQADVVIDNNGTLEDFYKQLDQLVK